MRKLSLLTLLLLLIPVFASAAVSLPKTGQTTSYAAGDDGDLKRGTPWPSPRFSDNGNGTVTDHLTDLIWLKDAGCLGKTDDWYNALSLINLLKSGSCGLSDGSDLSDWRLPNVNELMSLTDAGRSSPGLPAGHPFTGADFKYWSSTSRDNNYAWQVTIGTGVGGANGDGYKSGGGVLSVASIWPVRGESTTAAIAPVLRTGETERYADGADGDLQMGIAWPVPRFSDNGDGTATDLLTGLIWLNDAQCLGEKNWADALAAANALADGSCGLSDNSVAGDWRLPNINELRSLIDRSQNSPSLPVDHPFSEIPANPGLDFIRYWSSTTNSAPSPVSPPSAWGIYVNSSHVVAHINKDDTTSHYWLAVRGGTAVVTPAAGPGGGISPNTPQTVSLGDTVKFTLTPGNGYGVASANGCNGIRNGNTYTTGPIQVDCQVTATFGRQTPMPPYILVSPPWPSLTRYLQWPSLTRSILVTWGTTYGATYELQRSDNGGLFKPIAQRGLRSLLNSVTEQLTRGSYVYRVRATRSGLLPSEWVVSKPVVVR